MLLLRLRIHLVRHLAQGQTQTRGGRIRRLADNSAVVLHPVPAIAHRRGSNASGCGKLLQMNGGLQEPTSRNRTRDQFHKLSRTRRQIEASESSCTSLPPDGVSLPICGDLAHTTDQPPMSTTEPFLHLTMPPPSLAATTFPIPSHPHTCNCPQSGDRVKTYVRRNRPVACLDMDSSRPRFPSWRDRLPSSFPDRRRRYRHRCQ